MAEAQRGGVISELSFEQLQQLIAGAVAEARKPDPETAQKVEDERKRKETAKREMAEVAKVEIEAKANRQAACPHIKENGRTAIHGQIHSDGMYHPLCLRCQKEFPPVAAPREMAAQGIG